MTPVPRGLRSSVASGLCALAVCASLYSIEPLVAPGRWLPTAVLGVVALAAVLAGARSLTRAWWAPTLVGLAVATFGILAVYASPPGRFQALPSTASLARLGDTFRSGLAYIDGSGTPAEPNTQLELLVVGGAVLVLLLVDLVAIGLGASAWSGLALLALWLPGIVLDHAASGWAFAGTSIAYVALLTLTAAPSPGTRGAGGRRDAGRRTGAALAGVATVTVAAMILGPIVGLAPGWSSVRLPSFGSLTAGSLRLAQDLDLRDSLGVRSNEVELTYRADPIAVGPLRVFTLRDFDGEYWLRDDRPSTLEADGALLWPARDLANRPAGEAAPAATVVTVNIVGLREEHLPVPVMPRTIEALGEWSYDAERDEVSQAGTTREGMQYTIRANLLALSADSLRTLPTSYPADLDQYLAVPRTSRTNDVTARAAEVTAAATNRYDQALALQSYLRNTQEFTYSTEVPAGRTDDAVWDFLGSKTGFCVQSATTMTVMARTLGIPARLAVGFLPGSRGDDGLQVVSGRDSHAWPELFFPGAGWVRFEPTPAIQSGAPPRWADPAAAAGPAPVAEPNPRGDGVVPSASPTQAPQAGAAPGAVGSDRRIEIGAGVVVLLLAGASIVWGVRRRRTPAPHAIDSEIAWAHLRARLGATGIAWSDSRTPRQVVDLVTAELARRAGAPMRTDAHDALRELARAVEDDRYAPNPQGWDRSELDARIAMVLDELSRPVPVAVLSD